MTMRKQNCLKRGMAALLAVIIFLGTMPMHVFAIEDTTVAIKDANLVKAICKELGKDYMDGVTITQKEMESLTELVAENAGITDLTGLNKAINLEKLDLSGNDLSLFGTNKLWNVFYSDVEFKVCGFFG